MKNEIFISIDTDREQPIIIGKPPEHPKPANEEEAKLMIHNDINCVLLSLCRLIDVASINNYGDKSKLVDAAIMTLHEMKIEPTKNEENDGEK